MTVTESKLWQPLQLGSIKLSHRLALAPLTRYRNDAENVPLDMMTKYYADRACVPGTLIITEATGVSPTAEGEQHLPGVGTAKQMVGWKKIYRAIHDNKSFVFQQLWDTGRGSEPEWQKKNGFKYYSSGNLKVKGQDVAPEAMTEEDILQRIADFRQAARNVIDAGGDGVEVHGAHGYLIDQFTRDSCNNRTDRWGGSVENRNRFLLEIVKAVSEEIGADRVGLRLSPFGTFQDCYSNEPDTWEQTGAILSSLKEGGFKLAYISWVEPRFDPSLYGKTPAPGHPNPFGDRKQTILTFLEQWKNFTPFIVAGGYKGDNASEALDEKYKDYDVAIAFGRYFISNPDLVFRVKNKIELTPYNRPTFFIPESVEGYNDYEFSKEALEAEIRPYEAK